MRFVSICIVAFSLLFVPLLTGCGGTGGGGKYSKSPEADPMKGREIKPPPGFAPKEQAAKK